MRQPDIRSFCETRIPPPPRRYPLGDAAWLEQGALPPELTYDFAALWKLHPPEFGTVKMFDRTIAVPRWQQSYIRPYYFSGMWHAAEPLPEILQPFLAWAGSHGSYNSALLNWFGDGHHHIGAHTDDERQLVPGSPIMSISLGQCRKFRVRDKRDQNVVLDLDMPDRSYIVMGGDMQKRYTHEVPKVGG